ncbi:uncharacterized protein IL334_004667 [Kwoniella shivajii]|uniref:RING-type domain-containing protein n=1 Tax=Kwoniella shivajii TaxID=564305 RepID=A0ABZ1D1C3_9TREE|nr:hypothetical protein IL334_004667 [Kwoniella shivajii]
MSGAAVTSGAVLNSGWYTNAYSGPFRSGRLRAPSLLPGGRRPTVIPVQQTLVVDVAHNHNHNNEDNANVRRRETIFGPDVGEDDEPGWTEDKGQEIGVEKIKQWVEKSKNEEGLHATTTLQALVNLKRPTLLLQQLEQPISDEASGRPSIESTTEEEQDITLVSSSPISISSPRKRASTISTTPLHTLTFKYDATTPQVRIQLEIYPSPQPELAIIEGKESIVEDHEPKIIYSGVHNGGFNQSFTLPHTSALDLSSAIIPQEEQEQNMKNEAELQNTTNNSNGNNGTTLSNSQVPPPVTTSNDENQSRWGRGLFRRNRQDDLESGTNGIEMTNTTNRLDENGQPINPIINNENGINDVPGQHQNEAEKKKENERGMRLLIRIDGVGNEGQALPRKNAQLTHILISGTWAAENTATASINPVQATSAGKRVWVVKVARREAIIGSHTFLLKEIYGLSSTSTTSSSNSQYPPTQDDPYASTPNECIVCLTSPRDVVLLPCRHLVVCRDCAVGMVEYGAGGKVGRREDGETAGGAEASNGGTGTTAANGAGTTATTAGQPQVAGGTTTTGRERRKKKVKGWYCPVCRQPYTSLLRLALPESDKPSTNELSRVPSRAASVRTTRTARSMRAPSIAPTLPDGAERMLDSLRPAHADADVDDIESDNGDTTRINERPQFVLSDEGKQETEHEENANVNVQVNQVDHSFNGLDLAPPVNTTHNHHEQTETNGRSSLEGKGWKQVP